MPRRRLPLTGDNRIDAHLCARALGNEPRASMMTGRGASEVVRRRHPRPRNPTRLLLLPPARRSYEFNECRDKERVEKTWRRRGGGGADVWLGERVTESGAAFKGLSSSPVSCKFGRSWQSGEAGTRCWWWRKKNKQKHEKPEHTVE